MCAQKIQLKFFSTVFTALQPTGRFHLGNYVGSLRTILNIKEVHKTVIAPGDVFLCIADLHAQTLQDFNNLHERSLEAAAYMLASGINDGAITLFKQSDVPQHLELFWLLHCLTSTSKLEGMIQWKEKSDGGKKLAGLFSYPVLQAADILVYNSTLVPVGLDQRQHLELAIDLAKNLNARLKGFAVNVPEPVFPSGSKRYASIWITAVGVKIMDLRNPLKKMSKSSKSANGVIFLDDDAETIHKKLKKATTDTIADIYYDPVIRPGVSNLLLILSLTTGKTIETVIKEFGQHSCQKLKNDVAESLIEFLRPIQNEYRRLRSDPVFLESVLTRGSQQAVCVASANMKKIKRHLQNV